MVSKAMCALAEKVSNALLENPISQQSPGHTLSMQLLICFLPILSFSTCLVQNKLSVWRSNKRAMAREDVRGTEYSCQGDSFAPPAGLIRLELKSLTLRKSCQAQQKAKDNSLLIPEGLNLESCAAEFFSAHLTGR